MAQEKSTLNPFFLPLFPTDRVPKGFRARVLQDRKIGFQEIRGCTQGIRLIRKIFCPGSKLKNNLWAPGSTAKSLGLQGVQGPPPLRTSC